MIRLRPRVPAVELDRIAVGTFAKLCIRMISPKPGSSRSSTARVASGVTSRGEGPVPPVVRIRSQPSSSLSFLNKRFDGIALVRHDDADPLDLAVAGLVEDALDLRTAAVLVDSGAGAVAEGEAGDFHSLIFSTTRMSPMTMPLSTALHMS